MKSLAQRQLDDYDRRQPGLLFADSSISLTEPQAYEIQIAVADLRRTRGEAVAGYKIGCMSESIRRQLGIAHPVFGHVFASELHVSGCTLEHSGYDGLAIEGEYAVRIEEDIVNADWLQRNWPRAISSVFPVIELHNYVFRGPRPTSQELIANNAIHAGVVLPPEGSLKDLSEPIEVRIDGEPKGACTAAIAAGLLALVERLEPFGIQLRKGQLALTGSPLPLYGVGPGDRIEVSCAGLPPVATVIA
jgi:2-keto-4-pentenoate hydratase